MVVDDESSQNLMQRLTFTLNKCQKGDEFEGHYSPSFPNNRVFYIDSPPSPSPKLCWLVVPAP